MTTTHSIVEFTNPPVVEVVLSVAFEPIPELTLPRLALAWDREFKDTFRESEQHPPYQPPIERFGTERFGSGFTLELGGGPPTPRLWFLDKEGTNLLQLQDNWFARNWRKRDEAGAYIRYANLREAFRTDFGTFVKYARTEGLGEITPIQCEITYIDHIVPNDFWSTHEDVAKVFKLIDFSKNDFLRDPEDFRLAASYVISTDSSPPLGRLHINAQPAIRKSDGKPMFVVNTTARGTPLETSPEGVLAFLDVGHEWTVRAFIDFTTPEMHQAWGRKDA